MSGLKLAPVIIFIAVAGMFSLSLLKGDPTKLPSTLIGKPVPASNFPAVEGLLKQQQPVAGFTDKDLAKGEIIVVNFWASWCVACVAEHPNLKRLAQEARVPIYGVDYKDSDTAARRFLGRMGNPYNRVGTDKSGRIAIDWGVYGMPESYIVNGQGKIIYKHIGPIEDGDIEEKLLPIIKKARAEAKTEKQAQN